MSDYNSSALIAFREKLKTNVAMKPHLIDMLEEQAGGFMTRAEAKSVRNAEDPMGWLIENLLGKGDKEFNTFCDLLEQSNHHGWANSLRGKAEWYRTKNQTADRKAVVAFVRPAYNVEEADRDYLEKAIKTVVKNKKLDTLKLIKDLYRHTYFNVECILEANAQHFRNMVRAVELATEDEEDARALTTTRTVAELLDKLRIKTKWEETELLREIVHCLPEEARTLAMSLLKRYDGYLEVYDSLVPAQDSLQMQLAAPEGTKPQVPVEVTVSKCLAEFRNKDCKDIVNLLLHISYKIPLSKIMATDTKSGSTTVIFLIDKDFTENIIHSSRKVSSLWAFQELRVTRVRFGDFELNVLQLLTRHFKEALHSGLTGGVDFVGATKALPYQVYVLVDPDIVEELVIRTVYRKIAHPCPEQEELVSGTADDEGVETTPEMYEDNFPPKVEEEAEPHDKGKVKEATESGELSRVQELEDELKDSEEKRMDLTHENMALVNRLKDCQEQKHYTEQEIARLKKRLVSMLSSQGGADKDSAPTPPSEGPLKRIPHRWWLKVSAGSYDTSLLPSTPMKQAEGGKEMEGEVVFRRDTKSNLLKAVSGTDCMYRRGALERGRRANLRQHQFTRYHRRWLADNVQKEEEDSCKLWLLQSSPNVDTVRKREEHEADEGKMSEEVTGNGELLSRVQELEDELKDSERKRMDLIQSNAALQKNLKACREQEVRAQQEIASLWERLGGADKDSAPTPPSDVHSKSENVQEEESCEQSADEGSVREGEEQGLMSKVCEQALRDYQEEIAGVLIVNSILSDLEPYLTKVEYLQVESKFGNMAQVDELFRILLTKGNWHFKGFCHVLEDNGYQHWAQQLRSSTEGAETKGFTERDCSTLYHRAIRDNPTITLHVSKAVTIGPPRTGKTALHHLLLELEPPKVGHVPPSTPDRSIVNLSDSEDALASDESDDPVEQKVVEKRRFENHMCLVTKNKWVLVNNDSGILSLLTHLRDTIAAQSSTAQKTVDYEITAEASILPSTLETGGEEIIRSDTLETAAQGIILSDTHETAAKDIMLPITHKDMHGEAAIQPLGDKSSSVALISRIYRSLQNPDLADVALSDAHLLQFLDCEGQLAYHDILPLFVSIPAIYLNVFNVTEDLTEHPIDELCSTEGNKMYAAKSALSVAEMITRSVMTVRSLADRKVPLLPDVTCESKPRVILVGTHLDKLDEKDADEKLKSANEILHKSLQLKSRLLERAVALNMRSQLMFFPVNNILYVDKSHQSHKRCKCKHCRATKNLKGRITKQAMENAVKVDVPVRWYLHQLLELSQSEKPFYSYSELYERCRAEGCVTNVGEFHAMVTYFHALGLLIHLCGADVGHTEESACLVFTNPSYLFENISKLYLVQFEDVSGGDKILLKHEGKLTRNALQELGVQLNPDHFMDLLVQLFIGAEIKSQDGGRILFVPSVLTSSPDDAAPSGVSTGPQEDFLGFAITFENTSFIPCGVFTGMSARLHSAPGWEIFTESISRKRMTYAVGTIGTVTLFDHTTHISVNMDCHEGKFQEYRDTVIKAVADSYCFLFHSKSAKDPWSGPCSECVKSPYLVLGQTCQECRSLHDTPEAPHFAELKVDRVPIAIRCSRITTAKKLNRSECDLFQNMSHYAVIERQHTGCTLEGMESGGILPSQAGSKIPSSAYLPIGTQQSISSTQKVQASSTGN